MPKHPKPILVCANTAWYLWNFRLRLMETLLTEGYEVVACAPYDQYVEKIEAAGIRFLPVTIDRRGTNPIIEALLIARYWQIIRSVQPSIILTYTPKPNIYASLAARLLRIPVINNIAGLGFIFIQGGIKAAIVKQLYKKALAHSQQVFFQNRDDLREFLEAGLVREEQTGLLPGSGVDTERFAPRPPSPDKQGFTFLLIARMLWDKGIGEFCEAAKIIHSTSTINHPKFYLLGPVDEGNPAAIPKETLEQWNREGVVTWLGNCDDVRDAIADADCVVLPSYREGMPRTLLEAASMAKPIITSDVPGCREAVVDGISGYLCKARDACQLAERMVAMLALSPNERQMMGLAGRQRIESEFDERVVIDRYLTRISHWDTR